MIWKLSINTMELIMYVESSFMQVCAPSLSRAYCISAKPANNNVQTDYCPISRVTG